MYIKSFTQYQYINESLVDVTIEELIKIIFKQLDISYDDIKYLGRGWGGIAYDIGFGKIIKITTHADEGKTAAYLKQNNNSYIATIFDVFQIKTNLYKCLPTYDSKYRHIWSNMQIYFYKMIKNIEKCDKGDVYTLKRVSQSEYI